MATQNGIPGYAALKQAELGDIYRCYVYCDMGEQSWVSQEFGIRWGGKGKHVHCPHCSQPVSLPRNKTLSAATADRLKTLERDETRPQENQMVQGEKLGSTEPMLSADELVGKDLRLTTSIIIYSLEALPRAEGVGELKSGVVVHVIRKLAPKVFHVKFTTSNGRTYEGAATLSSLQLAEPVQSSGSALVQRIEAKAEEERAAAALVPEVRLSVGTATQGEATVSFPDQFARNGGKLLLENDTTSFLLRMSPWGNDRLYVNQSSDNRLLGYKDDCETLPTDSQAFEMGWDFTSSYCTVNAGHVFVVVNNANRILAVKLLGVKTKNLGHSQNEVRFEYRIY